MAKQKISESFQKLFNKVHFKPGEIVFFSWLGMKKYGYVKTYKETGWGIQYTVESNNTRYPCGIQIKGTKTTYNTGFIFYEDTRSIDPNELKRRAETKQSYGNSEVIRDTPRPIDESTNNASNKRRVSSTTNNKNAKPGKQSSRKNAILDSDSRMQSSDTKKRTDSKLADAIQRQRDFLNGFVKK
jgi:hypothetical protein